MMAVEGVKNEPSFVLVVEDNPAQRETLCDLLELEGFEFFACGTGAEASEIIGREELSVAILDLRLPDQSGTQILERIRRHDDKVQVILYTAYGSFDSAKDSVNLGAFAYLEKTAHPGELIRQVHLASKKWLREALRETEKRYRTLAELSLVGIFHTDSAGNFLWVNRRWCEITGMTVAEALGEGWQEGLDGDDREQVVAQWQEAVAAGERFLAEYRFRRADGDSTWVHGLARPEIEDGGDRVAGYVGSITDISQRMRAEERLRILEAALDQSVLPVAVTSADLDDPRFVWVNPAFTRLTGYSEAELLGHSVAVLNGAKTKHDVLERLRDRQRRGESFIGEMVNYRKGGAPFTVEWRVDPVRDRQGRIQRWVAIFR